MSKAAIKIVVFGDAKVGKSSILRTIAKEEFNENYTSTLAVDFKFVNILDTSLQFWDVPPGTNYCPEYLDSCVGAVDAVLYMYDVTSQESFDSVSKWIEQIRPKCRSCSLHYLVGNKKDLGDTVSLQNNVDSLVEKYRLDSSFKVSAKTGEGMDGMIFYILNDVLN